MLSKGQMHFSGIGIMSCIFAVSFQINVLPRLNANQGKLWCQRRSVSLNSRHVIYIKPNGIHVLKNSMEPNAGKIFSKCHMLSSQCKEGRCGCDRMAVGFTTTYAISAYHHWRCKFESRSWRGVLNTTLCDEVCQWLAATGSFFRALQFPPPIKLTVTIYLKYCWKWR